MNEKLNLVEILKDCPEGTGLYSTIFGEVTFDKIEEDQEYPIIFTINNGGVTIPVASDGRHLLDYNGDCTLFPSKEQRDWSEFTAPWYKKEKLVEPKFKVGNWYQCTKDFFGKSITFDKNTAYYCAQEGCLQDEYGCHIAIVKDLYDNFKVWTIQDAKDGDVLYSLDSNQPFIYKERNDYEQATAYCGLNMYGKFFVWGTKDCAITLNNYVPATKEQRDALMKAMNDAGYEWDGEKKELKKLKKPKFDPKTLQPFDRVLVRDKDYENWNCGFFSHKDASCIYHCRCIGTPYIYCIPYNEETKHLVGTNEEAPEYYKYWED